MWTIWIWHFLESVSTQRSAHLLLSSTYRFLGVGAHPSLFINLKVFRGCPTLTFHQPKGFQGVGWCRFQKMPNSNGSNGKKNWYTLSIEYSINPRDNLSGTGGTYILEFFFDLGLLPDLSPSLFLTFRKVFVLHCKYVQFLIVSTFHCNLVVRFTLIALSSPM